ncbi:unnamed protein product, partial [Cylicostephanus goldi]
HVWGTFLLQIRLVTFGEPRTGNVAFAKEIEEHIQFRYRVVKKNDFIASVPRSADPAASLLTATMYERQPLFYRYLVHYDNKMKKGDTFKICELSDDFGCRNTNFAYDLDDHRTYFHIDSDKFIEEGCPRDHFAFTSAKYGHDEVQRPCFAENIKNTQTPEPKYLFRQRKSSNVGNLVTVSHGSLNREAKQAKVNEQRTKLSLTSRTMKNLVRFNLSHAEVLGKSFQNCRDRIGRD